MGRRTQLLGLVTLSTCAIVGAPAALANHSFDVLPPSLQICLDGARFDGQTTAAGSLNLSLTPRVGVPTIVGGVVVSTTPVASGSPLVFTAVGQTQTFTVAYLSGTLAAGAPVVIGVTDLPADPFISDGTEGWASHTAMLTLTVGNCVLGLPPPAGSVSGIPTLTEWMLALLAVMLGGSALLRLRRWGNGS